MKEFFIEVDEKTYSILRNKNIVDKSGVIAPDKMKWFLELIDWKRFHKTFLKGE